jgi:hypothetical protein
MFEIKLIKDLIAQLLMGSYQVFDKIRQLKKKKTQPCLECLSPFRVASGSHFPLSVKAGTTMRALCHFLS